LTPYFINNIVYSNILNFIIINLIIRLFCWIYMAYFKKEQVYKI